MKTLYYNGKIITMEENKHQETVEAVLVEDKKIIGVGSYSELIKQAGKDYYKYNLEGKTIVPGFIDSHSHVTLVSTALQFVNLAAVPIGKVNNIEDIKRLLTQEFSNNKNKYDNNNWLVGNNYDNKDFKNNEVLTKFDLDQISQDIPIYVIHFSHHSGVCNSKLLEILNINENTIDPNNSFYGRVAGTNEPNGILKEEAINNHPEIRDKINNLPDRSVWMEIWKKVIAYYAEQGYTTVQDAVLTSKGYDFLSYLDKKNKLVLDVISHVSMYDDKMQTQAKKIWDLSTNIHKHLKIKGVKLIMDGTLELWTALLSEPYYTQINNNPKDFKGTKFANINKCHKLIKFCIENQLFN